MLGFVSSFVIAVSGPPAQEVSRFDGQRVGYTVTQTPGTAAAGATFELAVRLEELVKKADPTFGRRRLLQGASVVVYLLAPNGSVLDARIASPDGDDGEFAVHFTAPVDGIYSAVVRGSAPDGVTLDYAVLVGVGVWPMLTGIAPDPLPAKLPEPTSGDVVHGKALCVRPLKHLSAAVVERMTDDALVAELAPELVRPLERADLVAYVRSQFVRVSDFFKGPWTAVTVKLDGDALARLGTRDADGVVFAMNDKSGYVVFTRDGAIAISPRLKVLAARPSAKTDAAEARRAIELVNAVLIREREAASIEADLKQAP